MTTVQDYDLPKAHYFECSHCADHFLADELRFFEMFGWLCESCAEAMESDGEEGMKWADAPRLDKALTERGIAFEHSAQ